MTGEMLKYPHALERYAELARYCGIVGKDDRDTFNKFIDAIEQLKAGELHVFAGPLTGVSPDGQTIEIPEGDYYHEQEEQSAPSWQYIVEGCTAVE